jgi:acetylglutamate kinase
MLGMHEGLSMRLVLVLGVRKQMDQLLSARGIVPCFAAGFRVSDGDVMTAAAEATGAARTKVEAALSKVSFP